MVKLTQRMKVVKGNMIVFENIFVKTVKKTKGHQFVLAGRNRKKMVQ